MEPTNDDVPSTFKTGLNVDGGSSQLVPVPVDLRTQVHMAAIVESSEDAIIGKTLDGIVTVWNPGAEKMYGYTAEEMIGQSLERIVPPECMDELTELEHRLTSGISIQPYETVRLHKTGDIVNVRLKICAIRNHQGEVIGASSVARDIRTQQRERRELIEMQAASERRAVVLETAGRVALDILSSRTGVEALRHIANAARTLARAQYAALGVAKTDGNGIIEFATVGMSADQEAVIGSRPRGIGILGLLLTRTDPLRIDSLAHHPHSVGFPPNHPAMDSFLGVPIRRGNTVLGSLYLTNKEGGGPFTVEDEIAVEALGAYAAVAIHNLHMLSRQRALVSGLIAAQEEERRAVAYDLHDGLTQFVMASQAHMETFRRNYQAGNLDKAEREMNQGLQYLKEAVIESRRMVNGLRSLALDDLGLAGAIEQLLTEEKSRASWETADLIHNISDRRFDPTLETAVYRVAQEAVTNARKHASASRIRVTLLSVEEEIPNQENLSLEIKDWGDGFVPELKTEDYAHFGLHGMSERVQLLGGSYSLHSAPGVGTTVRAVFPAFKQDGPAV